MKAWIKIHLIPLLLVLLISSLAVWFFYTYEYVKTTTKSDSFQGEAGRNSFLAAQYFLKKFEINSDIAYVFSQKDLQNYDTLFIRQQIDFFPPQQLQALLNWVAQGGHFIYVTTKNDEHTDYIDKKKGSVLEQLNVSLHYQEDCDKKTDATDEQSIMATWQSQDFELLLNASPVYFSINNNPQTESLPVSLQYQVKEKCNDEMVKNYFLHYQYQQGYISLLTESHIFTNSYIDKHHHAGFLYALVNSHFSAHDVLFIPVLDNFPTLWSLLWDNAWMIIISMACLLLIWLWQSSRRFGSPYPLPTLERRQLLAHIEASGNYLWHYGESIILVDATRKNLFKHIFHIQPQWQLLPPEKICHHINQRLSIPIPHIYDALYTKKIDNRATFTHVMTTLAKIRKTI